MRYKNLVKEFRIWADPFNSDLISGILWELPIDGITEENDNLVIYAPEKTGIKKSDVEFQLNKLIQQGLINSFSVEVSEIENKNWNEEWEKSINVIEVTDKIVIKPTFKEYTTKSNQVIITIDPKMSFGTGEHQTTKLVLKLLEKFHLNEKSVLDVGTGTGILAIASIKLGARNAVAIDNDEWCYENSIENCQLNSVSEKIKVVLSGLNKVEEKNFDLILANIQKNILLDISNEIKNHISPAGFIILSGLLNNDEDDICSRYKSLGFTLFQKEQMDEWIALVFQNGVG
jgi:ribosomal protein L11 methyltransferase